MVSLYRNEALTRFGCHIQTVEFSHDDKSKEDFDLGTSDVLYNTKLWVQDIQRYSPSSTDIVHAISTKEPIVSCTIDTCTRAGFVNNLPKLDNSSPLSLSCQTNDSVISKNGARPILLSGA